MRTLFWGCFAGLVTAFVCSGVLALTDLMGLVEKILVVVGVSGSVAALIWTVGAVRGVLTRLRSNADRQHVGDRLRREPAPSRRDPTPLRSASRDSKPAPLPTPAPSGRRSRPVSAEAGSAMAEAEAAVLQGDFRGAAGLLTDYLDGSPDDVEAHLARGRIHLDLGDFNRAMSDFLTAEEIAPDSPEPPVAIGDLYFVRKDYERAIEYFDGALELDQNHAMALCRRGLSHYYRKNHAEALRDLERAQRLDPDIPNLKTHLALARKGSEPKGRRR